MFQQNFNLPDLFKMVSQSSNPQQMVQMLISTNPQFNSVYRLVQQRFGGDPKTAFYELARERGIDPESILKQLR